MKLFSEFRNGFNRGRAKAHAEAEARRNRKVIKLIEPNEGRIVTLEVLEEEPVLHMIIDLLTTLQGYKNATVNTSGKIVTITFANDSIADIFRETWRD